MSMRGVMTDAFFQLGQRCCLLRRHIAHDLKNVRAIVLPYPSQLYKRHPASMDTQTVAAVVKMADLPVLQWMHACKPKKFSLSTRKIFAVTSRNGCDDVARWLVKLFPVKACALTYAAEGGHLEQIEWLMGNAWYEKCSIGRVVSAAAARGDLETAQFFHGISTISYKVSVKKLAENDHRVVTEWLYEVKCGKCWRCLPNEAASSGRLEIVQWLHSKKMRGFSVHGMGRAAENGYLAAVKCLHANRREGCTSEAMIGVAGNDHLEVVQ